MTNISKKRLALYLAAVVAAGVSSPAYAFTCAVEGHVIQRTMQLDTAVTAQIVKSKTLLITEEERQRQLLLAALKVLTKQESGSGLQTSTVVKKSAEAAANANVTQRQAYQIADAKERYGVTGYDSCGLQTKSQSFYSANMAMSGKAASYRNGTYFKPGQYGSPKQWTALAQGGSNFDAEAIFSGNSSAAAEYINFIAGPPVEKLANSALASEFQTFEKNRNDARRSVVVNVLASIAAENEPGGPREKLAELTKHWTGDDGGTKWAQASADKPLRATLLDAVRIEAANIALMAFQVKDNARTELALSSYALSRVNRAVFNENGGVVAVGVGDRAGLQ
jgi:hypothetical protein